MPPEALDAMTSEDELNHPRRFKIDNVDGLKGNKESLHDAGSLALFLMKTLVVNFCCE